jgi:hypothetical protein
MKTMNSPDSTSTLQSDDHEGGENASGILLEQQELHLSNSSHLSRIARSSDMSERDTIPWNLPGGDYFGVWDPQPLGHVSFEPANDDKQI